jgi:polyphosphate kinase
MSTEQRLRFVSPQSGASPDPAAIDLTNPRLYINRELSWLAFNQRVLDHARAPQEPLLERVKFLAIAANNLDEFFMIRVATLTRQIRAGLNTISPDGMTLDQQLTAVRGRAEKMLLDISSCWRDELLPALRDAGIQIVDARGYTPSMVEYLTHHFSANVCPVLTPLAFDPGHPFPYISNRSCSLAIVVEDDDATKFARVKVPDVLPRFVLVPEAVSGFKGSTFVYLEDVIRQNVAELFPGVTLRSAHLFRIIRDTDIVLREEEAEDLLETVGRSLRELRHGPITLLQVESSMPPRVLDILVENFELTDDPVVVRSDARLGLADLGKLTTIPRPDLKDPPFVPRPVWRNREPEAIFDGIKYHDQIVHHPFDSFGPVEAFLDAAVDDPHVVAIKISLYRVGRNSPIVDRLIEAAERGKQVAALVELKARFDERSNIGWATRLEEAGVHVVYGLVNLKTHCKLCLVVRKEGDGIQRYVHVGTGNYNRTTAQIYTDLGLFTANADIVADVSELFNYLTGCSRQLRYRSLLVAPVALRQRFAALIEREITHAVEGRPAGMVIKTNSIADPSMIRMLYRASQHGVQIDAIVRGICCLRPGVRGVSDRIRVRSIVGRFLEHSRIYAFTNGGDHEVYIGSADLMERNLDRRVETLCPVYDAQIRRYLIDDVLQAYLRDDVQGTVLTADGRYEVESRPRTSLISAQQWLMGKRPHDL